MSIAPLNGHVKSNKESPGKAIITEVDVKTVYLQDCILHVIEGPKAYCRKK